MRMILFLASLILATMASAQPPGTLISAEPVAGSPARTRAWRIRYMTDEPRRGPMEVTGMVVAPERSGADRPVLAWTHGTWGVAEGCAPSRSAGFFKVTPALAALERGYVVVAPDYPGLGSAAPRRVPRTAPRRRSPGSMIASPGAPRRAIAGACDG